MALATFDIVSVLKRELRDSSCPASTLASLSGITSGRLSAYLLERVRCPVEDELKLRQTWTQLKKLVEFAKPLPLDFHKVGDLRRSLEMMESGILRVIVYEESKDAESEGQREQLLAHPTGAAGTAGRQENLSK